MRILIAGPTFPDSFAENVRSALVEMGHEVVGSEPEEIERYWSLPRKAMRALEERLWVDRPSRADRELYAIARSARPDMLLALTWDVHPEVLRAIGRICPGRRVLWWGDTVANCRRWGVRCWRNCRRSGEHCPRNCHRLAGHCCAAPQPAMSGRCWPSSCSARGCLARPCSGKRPCNSATAKRRPT